MQRSLGPKACKRVVTLFSAAGLIATGAYFTYLTITFPHWQQRSPKVLAFFDRLCPFVFFSAIFMDMPGKSWEVVLCWGLMSIFDAGLYGLIGAIVTSLFRRNQRMSSRAALMASLTTLLMGMTIGAGIWAFVCFAIGCGCVITVWQRNRWHSISHV